MWKEFAGILLVSVAGIYLAGLMQHASQAFAVEQLLWMIALGTIGLLAGLLLR